MKYLVSIMVLVWLAGCGDLNERTRISQSSSKNESSEATYADVQVAGAMKNVMWKGEMGGIIELDTISNKEGLYGLGPESYLRGEILISDGKAYVSRVRAGSSISVEQTSDVSAPFFVYANVEEWKPLQLPDSVKRISSLQQFIDLHTKEAKRPFAFRLSGTVSSANIHIQNLPEGTAVSNPEQAHEGQVNYSLGNEQVEVVGFFSTQHKGVFTHHDSFLHMHLITADKKKMGHLDAMRIDNMTLYLPVK